jgi:hypothetical protein
MIRVTPESPPSAPGGPTNFEAEVVELELLLPRSEMAALEAAAHRRCLTTGQLLRLLLCDFLATSERSRGLQESVPQAPRPRFGGEG